MPRPRFDRLAADKRDAILDAAEEEFAARGFGRASYNQIIERAGVSKGAMYYYFDDKADLYLTVIRRTFSGLLSAIGPMPETADPAGFWTQSNAMLGRAVAYLTGDPRRAELARGLLRSLGDAPDGVREILEQARTPMLAMLEVGQRAGAVRDDLPVDLLVAITMGLGEAMDTWLSTRWETLPPGGYAALEGKLMDIFRRVMEPVEPADDLRG